MQSTGVLKIRFAEGGLHLVLLGFKEEESRLVCKDVKRVCEQWEMRLLVFTFGRRQRRVCFEDRQGEGNGNIPSARQGGAAGISLLTNPGRVWKGGATLFFLFVTHVLNPSGHQVEGL